MVWIIKLTGLGLALSVGAVAAYDLPVRRLEAALGKHQDRLPQSDEQAARVAPVDVLTTGSVGTSPRRKGDRLGGPASTCTTRPPVTVTCLAGITVETRGAANVSILTRQDKPAG